VAGPGQHPAGRAGRSQERHRDARIWKALPKIVFSKTLEKVEGNSRLVTDGVAEEVANFPALDERIDLRLVETRTFGSRVVYLRYQPA
jgi:hypothetical protein